MQQKSRIWNGKGNVFCDWWWEGGNCFPAILSYGNNPIKRLWKQESAGNRRKQNTPSMPGEF